MVIFIIDGILDAMKLGTVDRLVISPERTAMLAPTDLNLPELLSSGFRKHIIFLPPSAYS